MQQATPASRRAFDSGASDGSFITFFAPFLIDTFALGNTPPSKYPIQL
jgi:hypothetical protein